MKDEVKNRVTVHIYGKKYTVVGTASTEHVEQVAAYLNQKMKEIGEKNPMLDTAKISVLTAINVVDDYLRLQEEYEKLLQIVENYAQE